MIIFGGKHVCACRALCEYCSTVAGGIERKSTRVWAQESGYDAEKIFHKVFTSFDTLAATLRS